MNSALGRTGDRHITDGYVDEVVRVRACNHQDLGTLLSINGCLLATQAIEDEVIRDAQFTISQANGAAGGGFEENRVGAWILVGVVDGLPQTPR